MSQKSNVKTPAAESKESKFAILPASVILAGKYGDVDPKMSKGLSPCKWLAMRNKQSKPFIEAMKEYRSLIKRGITILTIDGKLDSDTNNWDIDWIASIGMNTLITCTYGPDTYKFDIQKSLWVSDTGKELPYNLEDGMPAY